MGILRLLLILLLILLSSPTWATTWYVRPLSGEYGAEDGTSYETAFDDFADITWGTGGIVAGDTLYVAGTFTAADLIVGTAGTAGNHITIRGDYPADPGQIGNASTSRQICLNSYLTFSHLTVYGTMRSCIDSYYDSTGNVQFIASTNEVRDYGQGLIGLFTTSDQFFGRSVDSNTHGLGVASNPTDEGDYHRMYVSSTADGAMWPVTDETSATAVLYKHKKITDITVDSCTFTLVEDTTAPMDMCGINNVTITNNTVDMNDKTTYGAVFIDNNSVWKRPSNVTISNNYFHGAGNGATTYDDHCIYIQSVNNITVSNNTLKNCAAGIVVYPGAIATQAAEGVTITRNLIEGMDYNRNNKQFGGNGITFSGSDQCPLCTPATVAYNVITTPLNCPGTDLSSCTGISSKWSVQQKLYNNTIIATDRSFYFGSANSSADLRNNISYNPAQYHIYVNTTLGTWTEDYNHYYPNTGTLFYHGGAHNFADYQSGHPDVATRSVTHLYTTDPLFVSASNYQLTSASPAINAGTDVSLTTDYLGFPIVGNPDIGAYEYQTSSTGIGITLQGVSIR